MGHIYNPVPSRHRHKSLHNDALSTHAIPQSILALVVAANHDEAAPGDIDAGQPRRLVAAIQDGERFPVL